MRRDLLNCLLAGSVLCMVAACGGGRPSPHVNDDSVGVLKVGKPYQIEGRTYVPGYESEYVEEGVASWYGPGFHGRATANGEKFDQHALTAAHRTLPLPSMVEVTNLENGKTAVLTVNDRGPFSKERILDLSRASADRLGVISKGTARVRVRYLKDESRRMIEQRIASGKLKADEKTLAMLNFAGGSQGTIVQAAPAAMDYSFVSSAYADEPAVTTITTTETQVSTTAALAPVVSRDLPTPAGTAKLVRTEQVTRVALSDSPQSGTFIQAGSFSRSENAQELAQKLAPLGVTSVKPVDVSGRTWYRVRLGPLADDTGAGSALTAVRDMGIADARIIRE